MIVSAIAAYAQDLVIGKDNQIPWYLPADLQYFKKTTSHRTVLMGRRCFESIGKTLPNRQNLIVTRNLFYAASGCRIFHSVEEALQFADDSNESEVFIIGGGEIYRQTIDYCDRLYLTEVKVRVEGDVFFPAFDPEEWREVFHQYRTKDDKNVYDMTFRILERKR